MDKEGIDKKDESYERDVPRWDYQHVADLKRYKIQRKLGGKLLQIVYSDKCFANDFTKEYQKFLCGFHTTPEGGG